MSDDGLTEITPDRAVIMCGWDHVPHLDEETKRRTLASYPPHERKSRTTGVPGLGSGAVYPIETEQIIFDPFDFEIPKYWPRAYGMDVGWHRTAVVWGALDRSCDCLYIYSEHYQGGELPVIHATAIKARGEWIPGVIDPSANKRGEDDGERLLAQYRAHGLHLEKAINAVEAGIYEVRERMETGRLKISKLCRNTLEEREFYRRDENGKIVKKKDHAMDALRYLCTSGVQKAITEPSKHRYTGISAVGDSRAGY